ncbi:293_t:CDS:2 [Diversispora eburnea]|uniref:293_t:CDS:1 n=1 Tax=Diversispora eburnea TaxID=1213867 RepID=A0A9N9B7K0_9GLOM|nr:293_t:CDS:2 [Diversispora eburnea]
MDGCNTYSITRTAPISKLKFMLLTSLSLSISVEKEFSFSLSNYCQFHTIWDLGPLIKALDTSGFQISQKALKPLYTIESHSIEGFVMDWSGTVPEGLLLTGDMRTNIYLTTKSQKFITVPIGCVRLYESYQ